MTNLRTELDKVTETLDGSRIARDTRQELDNRLGALKSQLGKLPVAVDTVASPLVSDDWYGAEYYWGDENTGRRMRETARLETPASVAVRAVHIDHMTDYDLEHRRTPSSWSPRVEVTIGASDHILTGDLNAGEARRLAMHLLAAAELVDRG